LTATIIVPASLDDQTFDDIASQLAAFAAGEPLVVDARNCTFATPFGIIALLAVAESRAERPKFLCPDNADTKSYWARNRFFRYAEEIYDVQGTVPTARWSEGAAHLLEVTRISAADNAEPMLARIRERAQEVFDYTLGAKESVTKGLAEGIEALCQNVVQHSGRGGWVMMQMYNFRKSGQRVVLGGVCDAGVGLHYSLSGGRRRPMAEWMDDGAALESVTVHGLSRRRELGDGEKLRNLRGSVFRLDGKLSMRSGTARIAFAPPWADEPALQENLAAFPGVQVCFTIPGAASKTSSD
jgi:hypothetical protein